MTYQQEETTLHTHYDHELTTEVEGRTLTVQLDGFPVGSVVAYHSPHDGERYWYLLFNCDDQPIDHDLDIFDVLDDMLDRCHQYTADEAIDAVYAAGHCPVTGLSGSSPGNAWVLGVRPGLR